MNWLNNSNYTKVHVDYHRDHGDADIGTRAPWLITVDLGANLFCGVIFPSLPIQSRAVMDDFGDLVPVEKWA